MTSTLSHLDQLLQDRGSTYGTPLVNLSMCRKLIEEYRSQRPLAVYPDNRVAAHEQAMEMVLLKISRIATGQIHIDNYDDLIGYATIAKEMAAQIKNEKE